MTLLTLLFLPTFTPLAAGSPRYVSAPEHFRKLKMLGFARIFGPSPIFVDASREDARKESPRSKKASEILQVIMEKNLTRHGKLCDFYHSTVRLRCILRLVGGQQHAAACFQADTGMFAHKRLFRRAGVFSVLPYSPRSFSVVFPQRKQTF